MLIGKCFNLNKVVGRRAHVGVALIGGAFVSRPTFDVVRII
jgi:hypothetical protein